VSATVILEPWGSGDLPLLERLMGDPRMTEHLGGPESPEKIAERHSLPERVISALHDAAIGFRVRRATYRAVDKDEITEQTASRDLHHLVEVGLLVPQGEKRGRFYLAGAELKAIRKAIVDARDPRDNSDPFAAGA